MTRPYFEARQPIDRRFHQYQDIIRKRVADWRMDRHSGLIVPDRSGNMYHVDFVGDPQWTTGKFGRAVDLDGAGDGLRALTWKGISGAAPRSCEIFFLPRVGEDSALMHWGNSSDSSVNGARWEFRTDERVGSWVLRLEVQGGYTWGTTNVMDGEAHHALVTFEGPNVTDTEIYLDGKAETLSSSAQTIDTPKGSDVRIGFRDGANKRYFDGPVILAAIYDSCLSASEARILNKIARARCRW